MRPKNLDRITTKFGRAYERSRKYEQRKKDWQVEFFAACTQVVLRERRLPRKTLEEAAWDPKMYPGWHKVSDTDDGHVVIERDASLVAHTHINRNDGMVYQRGTQEEGPSLDDERLKEEDYWLWWSITEPTRVIKDPETWTDEQIAAVQKYMIPGKIKVRLVPPRKAKPEELENGQSDS